VDLSCIEYWLGWAALLTDIHGDCQRLDLLSEKTRLRAALLNAKHVSDTKSGHAIQMEQPAVVINAIREVAATISCAGRSPKH
jgi:hypothetical protein